MHISECFELGYVSKAHALRGEVQIVLDVDDPNAYQEMESVFIQQGDNLIPFFVESISISASKAIVAFDDILTREQAEALVSCKLFLPLAALPDLGEGNYYYHQLIGCHMIENEQPIGEVKEVYDSNGQHIIAVDHNDTEVLVPLSDDIVLKVDLKAKEIHVDLPDGLLEIYL